ncbi:MAG: PH domain-containing protein [Bacteroidota bacterium]
MKQTLLKAAGSPGGFFYERMLPSPDSGSPVPTGRLSPRIIRVWQWGIALRSAILPVAWGFYALYQPPFSPTQWIFWGALFALLILFWIVMVFKYPVWKWKNWRYSIDRNQIELHHGVWFRQQTVIPLNRVQHVDTRQGPLLRTMNVAAVAVSTAATVHEIPALDWKRSQEVRQQISNYARLAQEDV